MSRVLGAVALHYGKEYLAYVLESIREHVDEIVVYYTRLPSYGHSSHLICPDSRDELYQIARAFGCTWFEINGTTTEAKHRQKYIDYGRDHHFDQILIADSDEIHDPEKIPALLEEAAKRKVMRIGVAGSQWITPWQSFNEYVTDGFAPIRVINLHYASGEEVVNKGQIYHMGYCISDRLMNYKISCHGHKADFDQNKGWYINKWKNYKKGETKYLHPATDAYWIETKDLDKSSLPDIMKKHPYFKIDSVVPKKGCNCGT